MRPGRAVAVLMCVGVIAAGSAMSAAAEPVVTPGGEGGIDTEIVVPGSPGGTSRGPSEGGGAQPVGDSGPPPCSYRGITHLEAAAAGLAAPDGNPENLARGGGSYHLRECVTGGRTVVWIPDGTPGSAPLGVPVVTPEMLALEARSRLQLPVPAVGVSPDGANDNPALVNLPTWWWVVNPGALTQRTQAGSVWAQVTAEPVASSWVAGNGDRADCASLGMAYEGWMSDTQPGSCSYTYERAVASEQARIQVTWMVTWVGSGGSGGDLDPMVMETTRVMPVYERQAIVTSG